MIVGKGLETTPITMDVPVLTRDVVLRVLSSVNVDIKNFVAAYVFRTGGDVFKALVATILTQNTSDRNAMRAYDNLVRGLGDVTPENILRAGVGRVAELIRPAGMYRVRASKIVELARVVLERYHGDLNWIAKLPIDEARRLLLELPGVGEKTADVILVNLGKPAFPVDTHITRITLRLGLARSRSYGEVQRAWVNILGDAVDKYLEVHLRLIQFGRDVCRARGPRCDVCGFRDYCNYYRTRLGGLE
ncbi:endonuclease III domain-containing protein [Vulcanisaeta thermophila]|uniref:endonuclease III domain-containing protein n=1 Tax=Vulcanisaeta thermophila TaxID=867917 RepID=UPI000A70FEED|nr:endonuclease III [Vulcanisaeta thermophila]